MTPLCRRRKKVRVHRAIERLLPLIAQGNKRAQHLHHIRWQFSVGISHCVAHSRSMRGGHAHPPAIANGRRRVLRQSSWAAWQIDNAQAGLDMSARTTTRRFGA